MPASYDPFPKYLQIREVILHWLTSLEVGTKLPTEVKLAERFDVSRVTIRQALQSMERDGVIARRAGVGTWLARPAMARYDDRLTGPVENFFGLGLPSAAVFIGQGEVAADAEIADALRVPLGALVYKICRLRMLGGAPVLLLDSFFRLAIGRKISRLRLGNALFVPALRKLCAGGVWEEYQKIEAVAASKAVAAYLEVKARAPVLTVNRVFVDCTARPVVYFKTQFRADRYYYTVKLPQPKPVSGPRRRASR